MGIPVKDAIAAANRRYKRSLTLRYLIALALAAVLALCSYVLFRHIMSAVDRAAAVTAVSGSQRLLTQRVLAQCLLLAAADDDETRRDIKARLAQALSALEVNHQRLLADLDDPASLAAAAPDLACGCPARRVVFFAEQRAAQARPYHTWELAAWRKPSRNRMPNCSNSSRSVLARKSSASIS